MPKPPDIPPPASGPVTVVAPQVTFIAPAADSVFLIDATPSMPKIRIEATIGGVPAAAVAQIPFTWTVDVTFDAAAVCTFGKPGVVFSDQMPPVTTQGGVFTPAFPWIRGGRLTVTADAKIGGEVVRGTLALWIFATDPGWAAVKAELGDDTLRRIARHESGGVQFETDKGKARAGVPKLNRGKDGGGGICQVTPPNADDLWNWKTNIASGKRVFAEKRSIAAGFPQRHANSTQFKQLVQTLNQRRAQRGLPPLTVRVPPFDVDQLAKDTIRGFNGYAGGLHEFRVSVVNGELTLANVNEQAKTADAVWERVAPADRLQVGDPDYVEHVLKVVIP